MSINTFNHAPQDEIRGQYASDRILFASGSRLDAEADTGFDADSTGTLDVRGDGSLGFHTDGLWDEEDRWVPDTATGKVETGEDEFESNGLVIGRLGEEAMMDPDDEAARWLKEHDPDYKQ